MPLDASCSLIITKGTISPVSNFFTMLQVLEKLTLYFFSNRLFINFPVHILSINLLDHRYLSILHPDNIMVLHRTDNKFEDDNMTTLTLKLIIIFLVDRVTEITMKYPFVNNKHNYFTATTSLIFKILNKHIIQCF
jgi:hypothetical protein